MDWIGSKLKELMSVDSQCQCINCQKLGMIVLDGGYIVCDDRRCHEAARQKYQNEYGEFNCMRIYHCRCLFPVSESNNRSGTYNDPPPPKTPGAPNLFLGHIKLIISFSSSHQNYDACGRILLNQARRCTRLVCFCPRMSVYVCVCVSTPEAIS